jgi:thiamine pyrophosphate-dependent acetolactate synthase large subunit-like protein
MKVERRAVLERLRDHLSESDIVVAALAGTTADTYQVVHRPENLYLVGLGMVTQVSLGLALTLPESKVVSLDTDGSLLLAPSILSVAAASGAGNLRIIVFDNEQLFGSRGGAPSQTAAGADLTAMARAAGIPCADTVADDGGVAQAMDWLFSQPGPSLLTAKIALAGRAEGPSMDGQENKYRLVRRIEAIRGRAILAPPKP